MRNVFYNSDLGLLLLRVSVGMMMLLHGIAKLNHGVSGIKGMLASAGLPEFFAYGVFFGEVVAPMLIMAGYKTRSAAALMAVTMVVAVLLAHSHDLFSLGKHGGWAVELPALFFFAGLTLLFTGAGRYSLDKS